MSKQEAQNRWLLLAAALAGAAAPGCAPVPPPAPRPPRHAAVPLKNTAPPPRPTAPAREQPPPSDRSRPFRMPAVTWAELANGLSVATVTRRGLPLVEVRVVIPGGSAADGERTGLAALTAQLLLAGGAGVYPSRDLPARVESLGASLSIDAGRDAIVLGLRVAKEHLTEALELLGLMVQRPRLDTAELDKLKARAIAGASDRARGADNTRWGAQMVLFRDLYALPAEEHPYASFAATPAELAKIDAADCRAFHARWFVPKNTVVVVAGDTTPDAVRAAVERSFSDRRGDPPPVLSFTDPVAPESLKITVVDRPKSARSDVLVGMLGVERSAREWAALAVAGQVLGSRAAARLQGELGEPPSVERAAWSEPLDVAHGPAPLIAYAGVPAAKTGVAVKALLEQAERLATTAPAQEEVDAATRALAGSLAVRLDTPGALADEVVRLRVLGLPDDTVDGYRKELRDVTPAFAGKVASDVVRPAHAVVVVAGDAQVLGPMLSRFGEVKVVDPTRSFERERTIAMDPAAPLEQRAPAPAERRAPAGGAAR
jgi:zinc protease